MYKNVFFVKPWNHGLILTPNYRKVNFNVKYVYKGAYSEDIGFKIKQKFYTSDDVKCVFLYINKSSIVSATRAKFT